MVPSPTGVCGASMHTGGLPPLPRTVRAPIHGEDDLIPLAHREQDGCTRTIDFALLYAEQNDPARLAESLGHALGLFPACAGRYIRKAVQVKGMPEKEMRVCILCNNAGVAFTHRILEDPMPSALGPLPQSYFDRALGTEPVAGDNLGGPLFRIQVLDFIGGQILALSFTKGLSDIGGIGFFLSSWARLHRGEDPGAAPSVDRVGLETVVRDPFPKLETNFALLHRHGEGKGEKTSLAMVESPPIVVGLLINSEELKSKAVTLSEKSRQQRLVYNTDSLTEQEAAFAEVVESLEAAVPASMWMDYRELFNAKTHFGSAHGIIDLDLPSDPAGAAAMIWKYSNIANNSDFWAWKLAQPNTSSTANLFLSSWIQTISIQGIGGFDGSAPHGVTLCASFWQRFFDVRRLASASYAMLLPHVEGIQIQALLPRAAVARLAVKFHCEQWHPKLK